MNLGNFSLSIQGKNIEASKACYEYIGFTVFHGDISQKWIIMKNDTATTIRIMVLDRNGNPFLSNQQV